MERLRNTWVTLRPHGVGYTSKVAHGEASGGWMTPRLAAHPGSGQNRENKHETKKCYVGLEPTRTNPPRKYHNKKYTGALVIGTGSFEECLDFIHHVRCWAPAHKYRLFFESYTYKLFSLVKSKSIGASCNFVLGETPGLRQDHNETGSFCVRSRFCSFKHKHLHNIHVLLRFTGLKCL